MTVDARDVRTVEKGQSVASDPREGQSEQDPDAYDNVDDLVSSETPVDQYDTADMGVEGQEESDTEAQDGEAETAVEDKKFFLGTWETPEAAEVGVRELQATATRAFQKAAELERRLSEQSPVKEIDEEERSKAELEEFVRNPKGVIEQAAQRVIAQRDADEREFKQLYQSYGAEARAEIKSSYGDVLTDDVHKAAAELFKTDKLLTRWGESVTPQTFRGLDLEATVKGMWEFAYTKAIAKCAGKALQKAKAETTRDVKTNERKRQRLGVHAPGARGRSLGTSDKAEVAKMIAEMDAVRINTL